jgi:two-component system LytT family sensor kinase
MNAVLSGRDGAVSTLLAFYIPLAWSWALATPVVGAWSQWLQRRVPSLPGRILAHLPLLVALAVVHTWARRALVVAMGNTLGIPFHVTLLYFADLTVASYLAALWAAHGLRAHKQLMERERQRNVLQAQLTGAQMDYLELQLRPHFLFNALSTIAELGHEAPGNAGRMLRNVMSLLESAVARRGRRLVSLGEEIEALTPYLDIQRLRFSDWLVIEDDVDPAARKILVPQLILQPLVENAVHHGLVRRTAQGRITIRARIADGLELSVIDNGVGLQEASYHESRGLGLRNLRGRLQALYGDRARLTLAEGADGGTAAVLHLPLMPPGLPSSDGEAVLRDAPAPRQTFALKETALFSWARAHPIRAATALWSLVALLRVQHSFAYMWLRDRLSAEALRSAVVFDVLGALIWLVLTPIVLWFMRAVPIRRDKAVLRIGFHAAAGAVVAFAQAWALVGLTQGGAVALSGATTQVYAWNVAVYVILLVIAHGRDLETWVRDREVATERLQAELGEARFQRVMLELRPRVLLDTLRRLLTVLEQSPARAEKILADIGDFLRVTLDAIYEREVTLASERDGIRAYARVLAVDVSPDFQLELSIPVAALDERVPNGILRAALDAVHHHGARARVRIQVQPDAVGLQIMATAIAGSRSPIQPPDVGGDDGLQGYVEQGTVQILRRGPGEVRLRVPRATLPTGQSRMPHPSFIARAPSPRALLS